MLEENVEKRKKEKRMKWEIIKSKSLVVGKTSKATFMTYSGLFKRDPRIALGSKQRGSSFLSPQYLTGVWGEGWGGGWGRGREF